MKTISRFPGRLRSVLLCCMFVLSACTKVGPDFLRPPTAVSPNWLEKDSERLKGTTDYREWWKGFKDPALDRIIDKAYSQNLSLKAAGVRVLEARAQLGIAVGELYPQTQQVSGSTTYNRTSAKSPNVAALASSAGGSVELGYFQDQIALGAAWEIDLWGKFRRAVESADAGLLAAIADYDSVLVSLTADAATSYIQIRTLEKRLGIARQNAETQRESLRIAESRYKGGVTSERDVEQAKTVLFNTLATVPTLEAQLRQTKNALSLLIGLPPDDLAGFLEGSSDIPPPPPQIAIGIPADLLRRRPDIRSAELQAAAQSARIGVAKADLYPAFSLTGSFGFLSSDVGSAKLSDIASFGARTASVGPAVQWNILNYGRITNNVRVQDARFQALLITYQNAVLQAQREVEDSLAGFLRSQESAEFLAQSAAAARRSLDLAFVQYSQGSTDFTTVLTAQQALLTAQDSFATALGNISGNLVGVYRAIGGGWEIREGHELVPPEIIAVMAARTNWGKLLSPASYQPKEAGEGSEIRRPDW